MAGSRRCSRSGLEISRDRPSCTRLAAPFRSSAPSRSVRGSDAYSNATEVARCCRTTSFSEHMVAGAWGTSSRWLLATGEFGVPTPMGVDTSTVVKGLLYGGGTGQLMAQAVGSGATVTATLAASVVVMYAVKATGTLRISREGELLGLDLHEHGIVAYAEYVIHDPGMSPAALPSPAGKPHGSPVKGARSVEAE